MPINFSQIYQLVPNTYRHLYGLLTQNVEILTIGCVIFKSREKMRVVIADSEKRHSENRWRTTPQLNNRGNGTCIIKWQKLRIQDLGRSFDRSEFLCKYKFFRPGSAWTSWCASFDKKQRKFSAGWIFWFVLGCFLAAFGRRENTLFHGKSRLSTKHWNKV